MNGNARSPAALLCNCSSSASNDELSLPSVRGVAVGLLVRCRNGDARGGLAQVRVELPCPPAQDCQRLGFLGGGILALEYLHVLPGEEVLLVDLLLVKNEPHGGFRGFGR